MKHLLSTASSIWVIANLGFWMLPIFALTLIRLIFGAVPAIRSLCNQLIEIAYRTAVRINSFWMLHVVGIEVVVDGHLPEHPSPIVVVNHQSWFDIPVIHHVISARGPNLKFLIKKELVWVPIVGWLCYALGMPRLQRGSGSSSREKDFAAIQSATALLKVDRGALLIFAEGTRFTAEKHRNQNSPYRNLLTPRPGGLKIALNALDRDTPVMDVSIVYEGGDSNFWRCLGGATKRIHVTMHEHRADEITDPRTWLEQRWREKDRQFDVFD